jgi:hypothetical protein
LTDSARLARLIADLDSDTFGTRDVAERELARLGHAAEPALRMALNGSPSAEHRRRVERLLEALGAPQEQDVAASRAVEVLEWMGTPEARRLLKEYGRGAPGAWLTEEAAAALRRPRHKLEPHH